MKNRLQTLGLIGAAVLPAVFLLILMLVILGVINMGEGTNGALVFGSILATTIIVYKYIDMLTKVKAEEIAQGVGEMRGENAFLKDTNRDLQQMINDMEELYMLGKAYREQGKF